MNQLKSWLSLICVYLSILSWMSNNWITVWMFMEINVLFMIGLMSLNSNYSASSMMMKIFIIQLLISLTFMMFSLVYMMNLFMNCSFICLILLMMKLGFFPFHFWIINIVGKMNWLAFLILSSFYKLPPLMLAYNLLSMTNLTPFLISTTLMGSCLGINNTIIQKLLSYSSMVHICWIVLSMSLSLSIFYFYFFSYVFTLIVVVLIFYNLNMFYLNQFKLSTINNFSMFMVMMMILSLGGFPPFIGFLMKWVVSSFMLYCNLKMLIFLMISFSFLSVSFYFQLIYYLVLIYSTSMKWYFNIYLSSTKSFFLFFLLSFYIFMYWNV